MLKINYGLLDVTAADDATSVVSNVQDFSNAQEINTPDLDRLVVKKYETMEHNQWVLNGSYDLFPENPFEKEWGIWSKQLSDENGVFAEPIVLTLHFTKDHSSEGLTLYFRADTGDYASEFTIDYYDSSGNLLLTKEFVNNMAECFAESPVQNYRKIIITFRKTSLPFRYLKLTELKYGSIKIFDEESIIAASILEEIDPIGAELSINTMECTIYTSDFQLLDPQGIYQMLQQKQAINVQSTDDEGKTRDFGTFFLEEPNSEDDDTTTLTCVDFLGVIEKTEFMGGIYEQKNAGELFEEIMSSAEVDPDEYEIEESLRKKTITGWIPITNHREALHQWAFALGAVIDCTRNKKIRAYTIPEDMTGTITHDDKFIGHKVTLKPLVTGATITAHKYTIDEATTVAFEDNLPAGVNVLTFSAPYANLVADSGIISSYSANHVVLYMPEAGFVKITGNQYVDNTSIYSVSSPKLPANSKPNVINIDPSATLINAENAADVVKRVYNYKQNRYQDDGDIVLNKHRVGQLWKMNSLNNMDIDGRIVHMEIDLVTEIANISLLGIPMNRQEV